MDLKPIPKSVICIIVATILFCGLNLQQVGALDDEKSEYEKKRAKLEKMRAEKKSEYEKIRAEKIAEFVKMKNAGLEKVKKDELKKKRAEQIAEFEMNMASIENTDLKQKRAQVEKVLAEKNTELQKVFQNNAELEKVKKDELKKKRAEQIAEFEMNMAELEKEEKTKLEKMRAEKKSEYEKKLAEKIAEDTSVIQAEPLPSETISEEKAQNEKRITLENARKQLKGTYEKLVSEGTKERGEYGLARIDNLYNEMMAAKQRLESSSSTNLPDNMWGALLIGRYGDPEDHHADTDIYIINGESLVGDRLYLYKYYVFVGELAPNDSVAANCKIVDSKGTVVYETDYPPYVGEFTDTNMLFAFACGDFTPTKPDTYTIISTFDSNNTLQESDESNNVSIDTLVVY